jgi:hypothetical protein
MTTFGTMLAPRERAAVKKVAGRTVFGLWAAITQGVSHVAGERYCHTIPTTRSLGHTGAATEPSLTESFNMYSITLCFTVGRHNV